MIEIITFDRRGTVLDRAEADTDEAALVAARTLCDDRKQVSGWPVKSVGFYVEGQLVRMHEGRP